MNEKRVAVVELFKDKDATWLSIRDSKGRSAQLNIEYLAEKQTPMLRDILIQWASDQFNWPEFPQEG